jgi:hypothetical protein
VVVVVVVVVVIALLFIDNGYKTGTSGQYGLTCILGAPVRIEDDSLIWPCSALLFFRDTLLLYTPNPAKHPEVAVTKWASV